MEHWIGYTCAVLGVLFTIGAFVGRSWRQQVLADIAKQDKEQTEELSRVEREHGEEMARVEREWSDKFVALTSGFRDSFMALREKISQTELYNEREFISKGTFGVVVSELKKSMENLGLKIDGLAERLPPRA